VPLIGPGKSGSRKLHQVIRDRREQVPVEVVLQDGRSPPGPPRPAAWGARSVRSRRRRRSFARGPAAFFLVRPPHALPVADRASLRRARGPSAGWQLQPSCLSSRQMWAGMILHPARLSMRTATRQTRSTGSCRSRALGPRLSPCSMRRRLAALSFGLRPARPAFFSPARPADHELPRPPIHRLPYGTVELSGDFRLAHPLLEERAA